MLKKILTALFAAIIVLLLIGFNPLSPWFGRFLVEPEIKNAFHYDLHKLKELAEVKPKGVEKTNQ